MEQSLESITYLLEAIWIDEGFNNKTALRLTAARQDLWFHLYGCLAKKHFQSAAHIAVNIFGKKTYNKKIGHKSLQKLHYIIRHIEGSVVAKRNQSFSRAAACVLGLAKTTARNEEHRLEVDILYYVCVNNREKLEQLLLENRVIELKCNRCKGMTPIHFSVIWNNNDSLQVLLKFMGELIDQRDFYGLAPIHYAVEYANVISTRLLLQNGANVNLKLQSHSTPLHLAAFYVFPDLVVLLCEHGADVHTVNANGDTALLLASRSRRDIRERLGIHCTTISLLLRYGSSPNAQNFQKETPLYHVSLNCTDVNCAHLLVAAGATLFTSEGSQDKIYPCFNLGNSRSRKICQFLEKTRNSMPLRLDILCSIVVREALGAGFASNVKHFKLPREIEKILLFQKLPKLF